MSGIQGLVKTIWYNLRILPLAQAIKIPLVVGAKTTIKPCRKGCIVFNSNVKPASLIIGTEYYGFKPKGRSMIRILGKLIVNGSGSHWFGSNGDMTIREGASLKIGNNFQIGDSYRIVVSTDSEIGNDCMFSWDVMLLDTDCHIINNLDNELINKPRSFRVYDNVWIGAYVKILKGARIPTGSVISTNSVITQKLNEERCIYVNDRIVRNKVVWDKKQI